MSDRNWFMEKFYLAKRWIKHRRQKREVGFSDEDTWSLDHTVAKFVLPRLKRFKEVTNGFPAEMTEQRWDEALDLMIYAMEMYALGRWEWHEHGVNEEKVKAGMKLFSIHFKDLWW